MNKLIGVVMLLFVIGAEIIGLAHWLSPPELEYAENSPSAVERSLGR
ncbi:MAG TPA: hypothetical protein VGB82_19340 [Alphaproteobacteria bacterium]